MKTLTQPFHLRKDITKPMTALYNETLCGVYINFAQQNVESRWCKACLHDLKGSIKGSIKGSKKHREDVAMASAGFDVTPVIKHIVEQRFEPPTTL